MSPIIMHIDMNSYFASVEQQDNLAWRGKPVGVCEHLGGIIIAASIEAKKWGIKTGTPVWEARRLYPKIILTKTSPDRYRFYTARLLKIVSDYTDKVEKYSIDEVFLDVTKVCNVKVRNSIPMGVFYDKSEILNNPPIFNSQCQKEVLADPFHEAVNIAREIKRRIKIEMGDWLTCSVGIAANKLLAKIASDFKKPDGLTVIRPEDKDELYNMLKLTDVPGIGARQERRLRNIGIYSLKDLKNASLDTLIANFGTISGYHLYNMGQLEGSFKPAVEDGGAIKSMGHMYTLPQEFRGKEYLLPVLYKLSEMVALRLRRSRLMGNIVYCNIYNTREDYFHQSRKLSSYLYGGKEIFSECADMLSRGRPEMSVVRLIGVTVAGLSPLAYQQSLFGSEERGRSLSAAQDAINSKYGSFTLCPLPVRLAGSVIRDSIGFGRMREM